MVKFAKWQITIPHKISKVSFVSKTKYRVHSLVYDLVTNVLNDKSHRQEYVNWNLYTPLLIKAPQINLRIINRYKSKNILEIGNLALDCTFLSNIHGKE